MHSKFEQILDKIHSNETKSIDSFTFYRVHSKRLRKDSYL